MRDVLCKRFFGIRRRRASLILIEEKIQQIYLTSSRNQGEEKTPFLIGPQVDIPRKGMCK